MYRFAGAFGFVLLVFLVAGCGGSHPASPTAIATPESIRIELGGGSRTVLGSCDDVAAIEAAPSPPGEPPDYLAFSETACAGVTPDAMETPAPDATRPAGRRVVAISAGHGGPRNVGAVHHDHAGNVDLVEKDLNLDIARRLDVLLRADGYDTVLIRDCDCSVAADGGAQTTAQIRAESQARADVANARHADVLVVIHHDGSEDPLIAGTSVYYDPDRAFGDQSRRLAQSIHDALIASISGFPYADSDRGVLSDAPIGQRYGEAHTFLFGESAGFRATQMPAALGEALFVTNETEAALLQTDGMKQRIALGYRDGVERYFANAR